MLSISVLIYVQSLHIPVITPCLQIFYVDWEIGLKSTILDLYTQDCIRKMKTCFDCPGGQSNDSLAGMQNIIAAEKALLYLSASKFCVNEKG